MSSLSRSSSAGGGGGEKRVSYSAAPMSDVDLDMKKPPLPAQSEQRRAQSCVVGEPGAPPTFFQRASQVGSGVRSSFGSALKDPTLGRFAVSWLAPSPFPDPPGLGRMPTAAELYPDEQIKSKAAKDLCLPGSGWGHAWVMACACFVVVGSVAAKVVLMATSVELMADLHMSKRVYGIIGGLPSLSSIFACPFGGVVVDKIGSDRGCVLFAAIVLLGSGCAAIGVYIKSLPLLIAGQLFLGLGEKPLGSGQLVFIRLAADPAQVGFFFALASSVYRAASFVAFLVSPVVASASTYGYHGAIWLSTGLCFLSLLSTFPLLGKLKHLDPYLYGPTHPPTPPAAAGGEEEEIEGGGGVKGEGGGWWQDLQAYFKGLGDPGFLLLLTAISALYTALSALQTFVVIFLDQVHNIPPKRGSSYASIFDVVGMVLSPFFGRWMDKELWKAEGGKPPSAWQQRFWPAGSMQLWGTILTTLGLLLPIIAPPSWLAGFILISLGFAMGTSAMWPALPIFVPIESLGLALGLITSLLEAGILVTNVVIGELLEAGKGFREAILPLLLSLLVLTLVTSVLLLPRLHAVVSRGKG